MSSVLTAAETALVVVPESARETLHVRGADARSWLNGIISADIAALEPGGGAYGLLLTKQGKIQTDLDVIAVAGGLLLSVPEGLAESIRAALDRYLVMEDAELEAVPDVGWLRLHGARASAVARELSALGGVRGSGGVDWLGLGGAAVAVLRSELAAIAGEAVRLGGSGARLASPEDWDALRIARGFPLFGRDYGADDNPHEASLDQRAVSFSKGCYLGQEVVCMQDMRGRVKRRLVPLRLTGGSSEPADGEVSAAGAMVGHVTSSARDGAARLALARLRAPFFEPGTVLAVGDWRAEILAQDERR